MDGFRDSQAFRKLIPTLELQVGHAAPSYPTFQTPERCQDCPVVPPVLEGDRAGLAMLLILSHMARARASTQEAGHVAAHPREPQVLLAFSSRLKLSQEVVCS